MGARSTRTGGTASWPCSPVATAGRGSRGDLAATIAHLCSDEARYITGATIDVNGGQWMG